MKTEQLRVSLSFGRGPEHHLEQIAGAVATNLYGNPAFPQPPVTLTALQAAMDAFAAAQAAQAQGGTATTALKNIRKQELINVLKELAFYVQITSNNDLAALLSSGFEAVNNNRASMQLPKPETIRAANGLTSQTLVTVKAVKTARAYQIDVALLEDNGAPGPKFSGGIHTSSRNMNVEGLIPGRLYEYTVRAIGGSTGYSDWSDPVIHRAN